MPGLCGGPASAFLLRRAGGLRLGEGEAGNLKENLTPFWVGRVRDPTKIDKREKGNGNPDSNLSIGGP